MSLITRCPACGTKFKVVTDQLKVSEGWVRCGQCAEVFVGTLHMQASHTRTQDLSLEDSITEPLADFSDVTEGAKIASDLSGQESNACDVNLSEWQQHWTAPSNESLDIDLNENGKAVPVASMQTVDPSSIVDSPETQAVVIDINIDSKYPAEVIKLNEQEESDDVSFVRQARRRNFWRKPFVRVALSALCVALAVLMLLQVVVQQKDRLAAQEPGLRPSLQTLCKLLQCEIKPLQYIEAVVVDSSSFKKINADTYALSFSFKNTKEFSVAMPSLEVTLIDAQELPVVRRVFEPHQFGASNVFLNSGSISSSLITLQVLNTDGVGLDSATIATPVPAVPSVSGPIRVAGYRVLAFYP